MPPLLDAPGQTQDQAVYDFVTQISRAISDEFEFDILPPDVNIQPSFYAPPEIIDPVARVTQDDPHVPYSPTSGNVARPERPLMPGMSREQQEAQQTFTEQEPGSAAAFRAAEMATRPDVSTARWFQLDNGRIPQSRLSPLKGHDGHFARPAAARDFGAMEKAMRRALGKGFGVTDSYRTYAQQEALLYKRALGIAVADPGKSNHGWGMAFDLDVNDPAVLTWLRNHGAEYGFHELPGEAWHWDWKPDATYTRTAPKTKRRKPHRSARPSKPRPTDTAGFVSPRSDIVSPAFAFMAVRQELEQPFISKRGGGQREPVDLKTREGIIAQAKRMAAAYGWTGREWQALRWVVEGKGDVPGESNWDPNADNPTSSAYGIPQRLISAHPFPNAAAQKKWMNDPRAQISWMLAYIDGRYGSPLGAWAKKQQVGWY